MGIPLDELKTLPFLVHSLPPKEVYPFSQLPTGICKSGLVELSGPPGTGKTEWVLRFLSENPTLDVAWIEKDFTLFPTCFAEFKIDQNRILFLDLTGPNLKRSALWGISLIIQSQIFPVLVLSQVELDETELRHLQF